MANPFRGGGGGGEGVFSGITQGDKDESIQFLISKCQQFTHELIVWDPHNIPKEFLTIFFIMTENNYSFKITMNYRW